MAYMHGIRVIEQPTTMPTPVKNEAGVPIIFGTAPVNLAKDPDNATNVLFLCETFQDAKNALGYSDDYEHYTLCQSMDAHFKMFGVGPVVFCNVLDPAVHKTTETENDLAVEDGIAISENTGILTNGLTVSDEGGAMTIDTDYTLSFNDEGKLVITVIKVGVASVSISGNRLNPGAVQASDIIGSYDPEAGTETGLEMVRKVFPKFSLAPSLLACPGWSKKPEIALAMAEKCVDVNGIFKCECVVDLDTATATTFVKAKELKVENGYNNPHMIVLWPMVKWSGRIMAYSAAYVAMASMTDHNNDDVPNLSPSNRVLNVNAVVLHDGTEIDLDQIQANELNGEGIVTAYNFKGIRAWGNNTAAYPEVVDPKDRWIACRRFFTWWGNSFIINYFDKVDNPANYRLIESIVDSENVRANSLVSMGKCAGLKMVYDKADNPIANVIDGKIVFRQYLAPYTPAEDILNILEFDPSMIEAALGGDTE